jgi:acyl carrier protein
MRDTTKIESVVHDVVLGLLNERKPERHSVSNSDHLIAHLGFRSLDLAVLLARLEISLEGDPFAELVSITSVRTVGDICDAYRRLFAGEQPARDPEDQGASRAQRRRKATGRSE